MINQQNDSVFLTSINTSTNVKYKVWCTYTMVHRRRSANWSVNKIYGLPFGITIVEPLCEDWNGKRDQKPNDQRESSNLLVHDFPTHFLQLLPFPCNKFVQTWRNIAQHTQWHKVEQSKGLAGLARLREPSLHAPPANLNCCTMHCLFALLCPNDRQKSSRLYFFACSLRFQLTSSILSSTRWSDHCDL